MAHYEKCPSLKSIVSLKARAYKATKTVSWRHEKAYRAARSALEAAVRAERLVRDAAKFDDAALAIIVSSEDAQARKIVCTWASWAYKEGKRQLARSGMRRDPLIMALESGRLKGATMFDKTRVYPSCCTSAYCGKGSDSCPSCRFKPILDDFKRWREEHAAVREDPIWCPAVYTATRSIDKE